MPAKDLFNPDDAPTTQEVVALIQSSKRQPLRQPDRHIIKNLLSHRDDLVRQIAELKAQQPGA